MIDPEGASLTPGPNLYSELMRDLTEERRRKAALVTQRYSSALDLDLDIHVAARGVRIGADLLVRLVAVTGSVKLTQSATRI